MVSQTFAPASARLLKARCVSTVAFCESGCQAEQVMSVVVDSAMAAGVKLFIWSSLEPVNKISNGELSVGSFDSKSEVTEYLRASGLPFKLVSPAGFLGTFLAGPLSPKKQADGTYVVSLPVPATTIRPLVDIKNDFGMYVRTAIENPALSPGAEVLTGTALSYEDTLKQLSRRMLLCRTSDCCIADEDIQSDRQDVHIPPVQS